MDITLMMKKTNISLKNKSLNVMYGVQNNLKQHQIPSFENPLSITIKEYILSPNKSLVEDNMNE